jgi:hypothetical protein
MPLDPKKYDVKAFDAARAKFNANAKKGKIGSFNVNDYLLPGQTPPGSGVAGSTSNYDPRFGGIPGVPDPAVAAGGAIAGNLGNFDDLARLTGKTNALNFGEYTGRLPGYSDMSSVSSSNILSNLRGELPPDVVNLLGQKAAERGVGGGVSGSQFSNADYLRSLGLTSLDLKSKGEAGFTGAMDRLKAIPTFDPSSMFTTPKDVYEAGLQSSIFKSAPVPGQAAAYNQSQATLPFQQAAQSNLSDLWNKNRRGVFENAPRFA